MNNTLLKASLEKVKIAIAAYEDALIALGTSGAIEEYRLDTGQNVTRVTKADITKINTVLDSLYNRCATMEARLNGAGTVVWTPIC